MVDYLIEVEHLYKRMSDFEMKLPDPVSAFKLLDGSNISDDERKLALALEKDMKYEDMKSALKKGYLINFHQQQALSLPQLNVKKAFIIKVNTNHQNIHN